MDKWVDGWIKTVGIYLVGEKENTWVNKHEVLDKHHTRHVMPGLIIDGHAGKALLEDSPQGINIQDLASVEHESLVERGHDVLYGAITKG